MILCQQAVFHAASRKAAKVHKKPSKSTGGKRRSDGPGNEVVSSPSNQGVNIPLPGHNALASLNKNAWKRYTFEWCSVEKRSVIIKSV